MKIIHLSDLHIGKIVNGFSMIEDQRYILNQVADIIKRNQADVVILAGDIYDRSFPPSDAVNLFDEFLTTVILKLGVKVLAISGNHDSADRIHFGSNLFKRSDLFIEGNFLGEVNKVTLEDLFGKVNFYLLPFVEGARVREIFKDNDVQRINDGVCKIITEKIHLDKNQRNVMITHGYVTGGEDLIESDSERPVSIGGTDYIDAKIFADFNYTALGHLHGPQKVGSDKIRYSGSILKYSFSEEKQKKSVTLINLDKNGEIEIELIKLNPKRDMVTIKGEIDYLLSKEFYKDLNTEDFYRVILTDSGELIEPMAKLREIYSNIMVLEFEREDNEKSGKMSLTSKERESRSTEKLFEEFFSYQTGEIMDSDEKEFLLKIINEVDKDK